MCWKPITEESLWQKIYKSLEQMTPKQICFWENIAQIPEKWSLDPWGVQGGGFWVVAVIQARQLVIWYNDIEEGFNLSPYSRHGQIDEYSCDQDELLWIVAQLEKSLNTDHSLMN